MYAPAALQNNAYGAYMQHDGADQDDGENANEMYGTVFRQVTPQGQIPQQYSNHSQEQHVQQAQHGGEPPSQRNNSNGNGSRG